MLPSALKDVEFVKVHPAPRWALISHSTEFSMSVRSLEGPPLRRVPHPERVPRAFS